jgi:hypothetical protein
MIRFNYHQPAYERLFGDTPAAFLTERLRIPLATIGAALIAVTATSSIQTHRVAALESELTAIRSAIHAAGAGEIRAERLTADVARLRALQTGILTARREALATTNTIAEIGNGLPPQTWLTGVGSSPGGAWTIDGRSTHVGEIGTMLRRVQSIDAAATARLVSIAATGRTGRVLDFVIGWDRRP